MAADISVRFLLLDHIQALRSQGHHVIAVCAPGPWVEDLRRQGIEMWLVPMERELSPWRDLQSLLALVRCFRSNEFDVVHTHTPKAGLLGPLAARIAGVPVIVHTIHGLLFHDRQPRWRQRIYWIPEKITASLSHHLLSQSREDVEVCIQTGLCSANKVRYLGNGIDLERFQPQPEDARRPIRRDLGYSENDFVIGSVGRLVYEKGFYDLFAAAEITCAKFAQAKFLVIGPEEHDQKDAIPATRIAELAKRGIIRFAGMQSDITKWYAAMDAFVLPSHREGIPRACMEASASGLPVIASDIRGCREVVVNGETGILVAMNDAPQLAAAIERLMKNRDEASCMGKRGRVRICKSFNQHEVLERLRAFYAGIGQEQEASREA